MRAAQVGRWVAVVLLIILSGLGLQGGLSQLRSAETPAHQAHTAIQLAAAFVGLAAAVGLWTRRGWARVPLLMWAILITLAGGLAPMIRDGAGWSSRLGAGAASAVIAAGIVWVSGELRRT